MDRKEGGGGVGRGRLGGVAVLTRARSGEGEMGRVRTKRGQWGGGGGVMGKGRWEGGKGEGEKKGREGISQMDMMKCLGGYMECLGGMRLNFFLTLFTRATPGTPASII